MRHPTLILVPLSEYILSLMRSTHTEHKEHAKRMFRLNVQPMLNSSSEYVPRDDIVGQVNYLERVVNSLEVDDRRRSRTVDKRTISERICDYIRLYFPNEISFDNGLAEERVAEILWNFAYLITDADGKQVHAPNGKRKYRCLACGSDAGSSVGIRWLRHHLAAEGRKVGRCHMVTQKICDRLGIRFPPPPKGKGIWSREFVKGQGMSNQHHPNPNVASRSLRAHRQPRHLSASLTGTMHPMTIRDFRHLSASLTGTMHPMTIRDFRDNINRFLDDITNINVLPDAVVPIRKLLDQMESECNKAKIAPNDGMVSAITIRRMMGPVRKEVDLLHKDLQRSIQGNISPDIFGQFEKIHDHISKFEAICVNAIVVPAVASLVEEVGPLMSQKVNTGNIRSEDTLLGTGSVHPEDTTVLSDPCPSVDLLQAQQVQSISGSNALGYTHSSPEYSDHLVATIQVFRPSDEPAEALPGPSNWSMLNDEEFDAALNEEFDAAAGRSMLNDEEFDAALNEELDAALNEEFDAAAGRAILNDEEFDAALSSLLNEEFDAAAERSMFGNEEFDAPVQASSKEAALLACGCEDGGGEQQATSSQTPGQEAPAQEATAGEAAPEWSIHDNNADLI